MTLCKLSESRQSSSRLPYFHLELLYSNMLEKYQSDGKKDHYE